MITEGNNNNVYKHNLKVKNICKIQYINTKNFKCIYVHIIYIINSPACAPNAMLRKPQECYIA